MNKEKAIEALNELLNEIKNELKEYVYADSEYERYMVDEKVYEATLFCRSLYSSHKLSKRKNRFRKRYEKS